MKIKYHEDNENHGFVIIESEPQVRTIFTTQNAGTTRVPFPYIIYVVRYNKTRHGSFYCGGIYENGLNVYGKLTPLENLDDEILYLPTDYENKGLVCTPHEYDSKYYNSVQELVDFNINIWWQLIHDVEYFPFDNWKKQKLETLHEGRWKKETLRTSVSLRKRNQSFQIYLKRDGIVINKKWPTSLSIKDYEEEPNIFAKEDVKFVEGYDPEGCNCMYCIEYRKRYK